MKTVALIVVFASVPAIAAAQTIVNVGAGEVLTEENLSTGAFLGQVFQLGPQTIIEVNDGGEVAPLGFVDFSNDIDEPFGLLGTAVRVNDGGLFNGDSFNLTSVQDARIDVFDGGTVGGGLSIGSGTEVNVFGGFFGPFLFANPGSAVNLFGGTVGGRFSIFGDSTLNVVDGRFGGFAAASGAVVNVQGGELVGPSGAESGSIVNISGGLISGNFSAFPGAVVNLQVRDLFVDGLPVQLALDSPLEIDLDPGVEILATLADGTPLDLLVGEGAAGRQISPSALLTATRVVVPEPSTLAPAFVAIALLLKSRRLNLRRSR